MQIQKGILLCKAQYMKMFGIKWLLKGMYISKRICLIFERFNDMLKIDIRYMYISLLVIGLEF